MVQILMRIGTEFLWLYFFISYVRKYRIFLKADNNILTNKETKEATLENKNKKRHTKYLVTPPNLATFGAFSANHD